MIALGHLQHHRPHDGPFSPGRKHTTAKARLIARRVAGALALAGIPVFIGLIGVGLLALRSWLLTAAS